MKTLVAGCFISRTPNNRNPNFQYSKKLYEQGLSRNISKEIMIVLLALEVTRNTTLTIRNYA